VKYAERPHAVLTGDTLFVGDVGRPDLRASLGWSATDLGALLYTSLRDKLLPLPDATFVYPTHGAGSLCGKAIGKETFSTIGEQRASNYALQPMGQAAFIDLVTADQADAPAYFTYDAVLNSRERPTLDQALAREVTPLTITTLLAEQVRGTRSTRGTPQSLPLRTCLGASTSAWWVSTRPGPAPYSPPMNPWSLLPTPAQKWTPRCVSDALASTRWSDIWMAVSQAQPRHRISSPRQSEWGLMSRHRG
jgi:hypothetical protein